jgi:transcriptional regulator with XRE-family HTH domain
MNDQTDAIKKQLIVALKREIRNFCDEGTTQKEIAKRTRTNPPFISNFLNGNETGMNGLSITKLISMANGLGLKVKIAIGED